jgi:hypothetical protein
MCIPVPHNVVDVTEAARRDELRSFGSLDRLNRLGVSIKPVIVPGWEDFLGPW